VEWLPSQTIEAERKSAVIDESSVKRVTVDTTVMEQTTAYPTDARLYERARGPLIAFAQEAGVDLRQTYAGLAPRQALQVGRMRKASKRLKGYTGRAMRDLRSHRDDLPAGALVISPFLTGCVRRTYAAIFSFMAGVMPPMPMFGRSLLYVQSHCVA